MHDIFDDDSSWDGLSGFGYVAMLAGWGLSGWLLFGLGNQQGLEAATKCAAEAGCTVQSEKGLFGIEYKTVQHSPHAKAEAGE